MPTKNKFENNEDDSGDPFDNDPSIRVYHWPAAVVASCGAPSKPSGAPSLVALRAADWRFWELQGRWGDHGGDMSGGEALRG